MKCFDVMKKGPPKCWTTDLVQLVAERLRVNPSSPYLMVCDDEGRFVGLLGDRDLVVRVLAERRRPEYTTAGQVMARAPVCRAADDLEVARKVARKHPDRPVVCTDADGRPVGVIQPSELYRGITLRPPPARAA
jgi:CBS domain-containing protein